VLKRAVEVESKAVSLERVAAYSDLPTPRYRLPTDPPPGTSMVVRGEASLRFEGVCVRYRPKLPLALADCSFAIPRGANVGVCGRTGSGKTTLANCVFRMVELEAGRILLDGADIAHLGLGALRRRLGIIPQDPQVSEICQSSPRSWANFSVF
jgi:ABC-type multidrug transport system fused ATPase/permease subunit